MWLIFIVVCLPEVSNYNGSFVAVCPDPGSDVLWSCDFKSVRPSTFLLQLFMLV